DDAHVFSTGEILDIPEEPVTRHDGTVRIFHTVKAPIFDEEGNVKMTVGVSRDITGHMEKKTC
ncbi:MAG: PAS domain-containing protein, partial [Candidatus Omnitrophota bacterium]|nr:PAS domain-containing protein [Candidatus Omnitrophota bacterium]